jgi:branched-chain amino acid aminotransferase
MTKKVQLMMDHAYFEGKIVPAEDAKIRIASHTIQYGTGVFGGLRGYNFDGTRRMFRLKDHHERLMDAARIFGMDYFMDFDEFLATVTELVKANKPETGFYIRPFIYCDDEILTPKFCDLNYDLAMYMIPLGDYLDTSRGLKLMISSFKKFSDASISTKAKANGAYLHASAARTEAIRNGYDEALVMDDNWNIVEGSAENLMIVYRGEVILPDLGSSMLEGITMRTMIQIMDDEGIAYRYGKIDRSMLYTADEIILTGTGAQVVFAESIDGREVNKSAGAICTKLRRAYDDILQMKHSRSNEWVTEFTI